MLHQIEKQNIDNAFKSYNDDQREKTKHARQMQQDYRGFIDKQVEAKANMNFTSELKLT